MRNQTTSVHISELGKTSRTLIVVMVTFSIAISFLIGLQYFMLEEEARVIKETNHQVLRQASNEVLKLQKSVERYVSGQETFEDVSVYYDILYSRAKTLENKRNLDVFENYVEDILLYTSKIYRLEAILNKISSPVSPFIDEFRNELNILQNGWEEVNFYVFQEAVEKSDKRKMHQISLSMLIGASLLVLVISVCWLIYVLIKEAKLKKEAYIRERQLTTQLIMAKEAVEAASDAKSDFLQTMSHELRTPLNAISGFTQILEKTPLNEKQTEYLKYLNQSSDKLSQLIRDILDYAELESESFECKFSETSVNVIISDLKTYLYRLIAEEKKNIELKVNVANNVPHSIITDLRQISRVFAHIGANAVRFSDAGEVHLSFSCENIEGRVHLVCRIQDFGIGISPEDQEIIFDVFTQVERGLSRKYDGTGLGLSVSKRLILLLGGDITLHSELGKGSIFSIKLLIET